MAGDLARSPSSGLTVQLCGDAHLSNFGAFATPERRLVFDLNDFDETHPGPFEWDVKRLCASLTVAAQNNGFSAEAPASGRRWRRRPPTARPCARSRARATSTSGTPTSTWRRPSGRWASTSARKVTARAQAALKKARSRNSLQALGKLTTTVDGQRPHPQPTAAARPGGGAVAGGGGGRDLRDAARPRAVLPDDAAERPSAPAGAVQAGPGGAQGRRGGQRRALAPGSCCSRGSTAATRCSCRPRRPSARSSRTSSTARRSSTRASAWCAAST